MDLKMLTAVSQPEVGRKFIWILRIWNRYQGEQR